MLDFQVRFDTICVSGINYRIRSLLDLQQYFDPLGEAKLAGISSASWSLFGKIWPSARVLALAMSTFELAEKRILEIGAGLALPSLVAHRRAANVTVSDWHPLSEAFLQQNVLLNGLEPIKYHLGSWDQSNAGLGIFDLIVGSDVLYERQQPKQLAAFIDRHAAKTVEVIIVDPDRGNRSGFCHEMSLLGYQFNSRPAERVMENGDAYKGRFLTFTR